ncbi:MAG TPA: hypothetical protein VFM21_04810 [Terriglobia bacterium]|nr:hypothetical protein [Terriglobia bacterium]
MTEPIAQEKLTRRRPNRAYRSTSSVDRLNARHPGVRAFVERRLRRRVGQRAISQEVKKRFGLALSASAISRFWRRDVRPAEDAEASDYRQAHAQARAILEEIHADPDLDASQIAELMLANAIVRDRSKLAEADIMDLYKEQRERKKLELQRKALRLRERQTVQILKKTKKPKYDTQLPPEVLHQIRAIYGLNDPLPAADPAAPDLSS